MVSCSGLVRSCFLTVLLFDSRDVYDSDDESDSASLPASFLSPSALACLLALLLSALIVTRLVVLSLQYI
jgi:hypothetical protein